MSSDDYEDFDETAADDGADEEEVVEEVEAAEGEKAPSGDGEGRTFTELEEAEQLTVSAKEALRRQLEEEMERFLSQGGRVQEIPPDVTADPPKKPESSYGSKPI